MEKAGLLIGIGGGGGALEGLTIDLEVIGKELIEEFVEDKVELGDILFNSF